MVKRHGKDRKMPFHHLHRRTPFDVEDLEAERITTIFNDEGAQVLKDQWTVVAASSEFEPADEISDGSFEKIDK